MVVNKARDLTVADGFSFVLNSLQLKLNFEADLECNLNTPKRLEKMFVNELLIGYTQNPAEILSKTFEGESNDMVVVKDIPFVSLCAHHWLPFIGKAYVGYIPRKQKDKYVIVGLSKIPRVVHCFAKRFQTQENMTNEIANAIQEYLNPMGCMVITEAKHLCAQIRGVQAQDTTMICSAIRKDFNKDSVKNEFLKFVRI